MKKYPKIYYLQWALLLVWTGLLVFSLLISLGAISWHSKITVWQYVLNGLGLISAICNIHFWKKHESSESENSPHQKCI